MAARPDGVTVTVSCDEHYAMEATYLVGADGGRSTVRKMAGIDFPGYTSNTVARIAHVQCPTNCAAPTGARHSGVGPLPWGHNRLDTGGFIYAEFERERPMVGTIEFDEVAGDESEPMTIDELRDSARRVLGVDLPVEPPTGDGAPCVAADRRARTPVRPTAIAPETSSCWGIRRTCTRRWAARA